MGLTASLMSRHIFINVALPLFTSCLLKFPSSCTVDPQGNHAWQQQ